MESMRLNSETIDSARLSILAEQFRSKAIDAVVRNWIVYAGNFDVGVTIS